MQLTAFQCAHYVHFLGSLWPQNWHKRPNIDFHKLDLHPSDEIQPLISLVLQGENVKIVAKVYCSGDKLKYHQEALERVKLHLNSLVHTNKNSVRVLHLLYIN